MASESKKRRVESEEDSSLLMRSEMPTEPTEGTAKEELYKLPLGAKIDFTIKSHLTDTTFVVEGRKIYAGSDFLCILSPYFPVLLKGGFAESGMKEVPLIDVTYDEFHEMLRCLSDPSRQIKDEVVVSLLMLGDRYDIKWLVDRAEDFLITTKEFSVSQKLLLADRYRLIKLQVTCLDSLTSELRDQVESSDEYAQLSKSAKDVLKKPEANCVDLRKTRKVKEPDGGFIAMGMLAADGCIEEDMEAVCSSSRLCSSTLDLAGLIWKFNVITAEDESDSASDSESSYVPEFKWPSLHINKGCVSSLEWTVEGFVEATMFILDLEKGVEHRKIKKTFAFKLNNSTLTGDMSKLMETMVEDTQKWGLHEFADLTVYITRTSGVRPSPNFDFTVPSELTDVAFIVEGRKVHVNRQYMSVLSSRFFEMFYDSDEVEVKNVEYKEFIQFLQWIYPSQRRYLTASWMFSTLKIARQLGVEIDTSAIERYFSADKLNVLYLERMIFYIEFNIGNEEKLTEGVWYGMREKTRHPYQSKLNAAVDLLEDFPLFAKMTAEKKVALYKWILKAEYADYARTE